MEFRSISIPLQQRVFYHVRDVWSRSGEPYAELETIRSLPSDLRKAILSEVPTSLLCCCNLGLHSKAQLALVLCKAHLDLELPCKAHCGTSLLCCCSQCSVCLCAQLLPAHLHQTIL